MSRDSTFTVRATWCGPGDFGTTRESIRAMADRLQQAGFNAIFCNVKGGDRRIFWPSTRFRAVVADRYQDVDFPAMLLEACDARGIAVHAWFIDFCEGEQGEPYASHPEWAMRDAHGRTTADETLRGRRYGTVWMCPARRPGYADQWLAPMMREFAERYPVASIHHDYVRYPGDLAPDQYCFCDYCLEQMPFFNDFVTRAYPDEPFYHERYDRPYLEAHWEQSPRVLPPNWARLDRSFRSRFLLEGGFFTGGRCDLDYFFYTYRTHWIDEFTRLAATEVRAVRPGMELSAAVFKNPIHSGRFIGQDWRHFPPWVDICAPMDYRDHFPGTFDNYLDLLEETIHSQKAWAAGYRQLLIGIALNYLFKEESPDGPWPPEKAKRVIERVRGCGVPGIVLFALDQLTRFELWDVVTSTFSA